MNTAINIKGIETTARVDMFFFVVEIGIVLIIVIGGSSTCSAAEAPES